MATKEAYLANRNDETGKAYLELLIKHVAPDGYQNKPTENYYALLGDENEKHKISSCAELYTDIKIGERPIFVRGKGTLKNVFGSRSESGSRGIENDERSFENETNNEVKLSVNATLFSKQVERPYDDVTGSRKSLERANEKLTDDVAGLRKLLRLRGKVTKGKVFSDHQSEDAARAISNRTFIHYFIKKPQYLVFLLKKSIPLFDI